MKRNTFAVAFYCRDCKKSVKNGLSPVEMAISVNGKRSFVALPRKMEPSSFDKDFRSRRNNETKDFCKAYELKVNSVITDLLLASKPVTVDTVKYALANGVANSCTLSECFNDYLETVKRKTLSGLTYGTYRKYELSFKAFIDNVGNKDINEVTSTDIQRYIAHINEEHNGGTVRGYILRVKSAFLQARNDGKLKTNPFQGIKVANPKAKLEIITDEEYRRIVSKRFSIPRLEKVRQLFILAANTGMAYSDLMLLEKKDINVQDGKMYVEKNRKKTGVQYTSVVLEDGRRILEEYDNDITPLKMSNQKLNAFLSEIKEICGIKGRLTFHCGRHYYCSHLIKSGVPIAIVQRMMGHSRIQTTQMFYTHLTTDSVLDNVSKAFAS